MVKKPLIAIVGCEARRDYMVAQRATWVPFVTEYEVRFFLAQQDRDPLSDEIFLPHCGDGYKELPAKVLEMVKWAAWCNYPSLLKIDDDVVVFPHRLTFPEGDYCGVPQRPTPELTWCMGMAYFLSRRSIVTLATARLTNQTAEDFWVSQALRNYGIRATETPGILFARKDLRPTVDLPAIAFQKRCMGFNRGACSQAAILGEFSAQEIPLAWAAFK